MRKRKEEKFTDINLCFTSQDRSAACNCDITESALTVLRGGGTGCSSESLKDRVEGGGCF